MTREEKIRILEEAQERAFKQIANTDGRAMGTEEFIRLLGAAHQLGWMAYPEETIPRDAGTIAPDEVQPEPVKPEPEKPEPEKPEPEKPEPEKPETGDDEEPAFKMEEVRGALSKARARGVNVSEIIRSFGAENFQQIPKNQYGAIMAKLEKLEKV